MQIEAGSPGWVKAANVFTKPGEARGIGSVKPSVSATLSAVANDRMFTDVNGKDRCFRVICHPMKVMHKGVQLEITQGVLFCDKALMALKQRKAQPTLLLVRHDWEQLRRPAITHEGAFGNDFEHLQEWVAVWKFPADLNQIHGFKRLVGVPLPVGRYNFMDDGWWPCSGPQSLDGLTVNSDVVEKVRIDLEVGPPVHHLEQPHEGGVQVACIATGYFIKGFWNQNAVTPEIVAMLSDLYRQRIYAFPCYSQHHAIVFFADLETGDSLITPRKLARILMSTRGAAIVETLQRGAGSNAEPGALQIWSDNYVSAYGTPQLGDRYPELGLGF